MQGKNIKIFAFCEKKGIITLATSQYDGGIYYEGTDGYPIWTNFN